MKIDFKKIDLRQGKYWFPLVLFVPLVAIAYFSCEMFKGTTVQEGMVTDSINTMMPEPAGDGLLYFGPHLGATGEKSPCLLVYKSTGKGIEGV